MGQLTDMLTALVDLERQVSDAAKAADPADEMRIYPWRPSGVPELPAIWNWIDDGSTEVPDTARLDDIIVVTATIGVRPSDLGETMDRLVRLTDIARDVIDPALKSRPVLGGAARSARRIVTRTDIEVFNEVPVMCMDMLIRVELARLI